MRPPRCASSRGADARGQSKFDRVIVAADRLGSGPDAATSVRRLREPALRDERAPPWTGTLRTNDGFV
jgi:hypothetical protein